KFPFQPTASCYRPSEPLDIPFRGHREHAKPTVRNVPTKRFLFHKNNRFCARKPLIFTVFHFATTIAIFQMKTIGSGFSADFLRNKSAVPTNGQKCHVVSWL
ncbi:MAG: hypothetical protein OEY97_12275, partial [Nitrospirota bacterium]|nr:hypothetical protein [Nitrospirota bacterium]